MTPPEAPITESPDRFEPSPQQKAKQGKSASKRIALFVFIGAGLVFTLVAMSILSSDTTIGGSNAPVNLFEASRGAESVPLPRPQPPEPEPEPILAEPVPHPAPPRTRPVYIPVPKVSERRKREQARRLVAAGAPSTIQAFSDVQRREGTAQTARQPVPVRVTEETSALAEAARLLGDIPVPQAGQGQADTSPFMPQSAGGGNNDPNGWARKEAFIRQNLPEEYSQHIRTSPRTPLELKSGALLPCVLISGLNSDLPGNMVAQVSENVYDSATGRLLLIPRGSKVIGTYDNQISYGQSRVLVIWSRLVFPDGSTLVLDNLGGADQSGYSGFKGKVNRHWGPIISSALMVSLLGAGVELAAPTRNGDRDEDDPRSILAENAATAVAQAITQIIQREANRQPTIKVKPGYRFMIFVQRDILFPRLWR